MIENQKELAHELDFKLRYLGQKKRSIQDKLVLQEFHLKSAIDKTQNLRKADLDQIRSFIKPPINVEFVMKLVYLMVTNQNVRQVSWPQIRIFMARDIIRNIVNFKIADVPIRTIDYLSQTFLHSPDWNLEKFKKTSIAIFAIAVWAQAQLNYGQALRELGPDIKLVAELEEDGDRMKKKLEALRNSHNLY